MKRLVFFLLAFCLMAAGCNDTEQKPILPKPKVTVEIAKADIRTIDLTLSVLASGNELDSWGIVYCEIDDREKGKEKAAELGTVRNHINTRLNTLDELIRK